MTLPDYPHTDSDAWRDAEAAIQDLTAAGKRKRDDMSQRPVDDTELTWVSEHAAELTRYAGEWIAVKVDRVVAHGKTLRDVSQQAEALGIDNPFYTKIGDVSDSETPLMTRLT